MKHNPAALRPAVEPVQRGGFESLAQVEGVQGPDLRHVRLEPEEEPGHFPPKRSVPRAHPCRLVDLFGEVHDPRLKPEGLVMYISAAAALPCRSPVRLQRCTTNCGGFLSWFGTLLAPSGEPPS